MTSIREQVLSEFIDAWNAGARPDVDDYIARVPDAERPALGEELLAFVTFAPTPAYSDETLAAIEDEVVAQGRAAPAGVFSALLAQLRERIGLSTDEVAHELVADLGLRDDQAPKAAGYLEQLEAGSLEPTRVSRRVFDALGRLLGLAGAEFEGAAGRVPPPLLSAADAAPVFRADEDAATRAAHHLDVLGDALAAPGSGSRDEVDDLFLGGP